MNNENDLGADAAEVDLAGSIASDAASHVARRPGTWVVHYDGGLEEYQVLLDEPGPGWDVVATLEQQSDDRACAYLIAAAPDYHEAMIECLKPDHGYNIEYVSIPRLVWRKFLAAHAKASGRERPSASVSEIGSVPSAAQEKAGSQ